ncbi:MAG: hypothetical protein R2708_06765 [Vicinamibacterales bacterium]
MTSHLTHDDAVLHYYGESGAAAPRIDAHLAACPDCRTAFDGLRQTLAAVDAVPEAEPGADLEDRLWARIEPHLHRSWWRRPVVVRRWVPMGAVAALVVAAFWTGRLVQPASETPGAPVEAAAPGGDEGRRTRVLLVAVGDLLERSEMVLSELVNAPDAGHAGPAVDRARASDLVAAGRLYRQTAAATGDDTLEATLDELERVLIEIANAPGDLSDDDLNALRDRIARRGLLFRVRVLTGDLRARETGPAAPARGASGKGPTS